MNLDNKLEAMELLKREHAISNALATISHATEAGDRLKLQTLGLSFEVASESLELLLKSEQIEINRKLKEI